MDSWDEPLDHDAAGERPDDEQAVRRYLTWVEDPSRLRDDERIAELRQRIATADDPVDKVRWVSELHRAEQVDGDEVRAAFVAVARRWAEANRIVPEAFLQLGVPAEDLRAAGFDVAARAPRRRSETGTVPPSRRRAPRANVEAIRSGAMSFDGPFTVADLRDRVGGSPATVRKALEEMVAQGRVENLGPDGEWGGPGRPPNRYAAVGG